MTRSIKKTSSRKITSKRSAKTDLQTKLTDASLEYHIRGISIFDLTESCSALDVWALLWYGELPGAELRADLQCRMMELPEIEPAVLTRIKELPWHLSQREVLRLAMLELAQFDERHDDRSVEGRIEACLTFMYQLTRIAAIRYCSTQGVPLPHCEGLQDLPELMLTLLRGEVPERLDTDVINILLTLFAITPESVDALAVRAVAAGSGDLISALLGGFGAESSSGIAKEADAIFQRLDEIESEADLERLVGEIAAGESVLPGFHAERSKVEATREEILSACCTRLAIDRGQNGFEQVAKRLEEAAGPSRPSASWPLARLFYYLGLEHELIVPLLTLARFPGWTAHFLEQCGQPLELDWTYSGRKLSDLDRTED